MYLRSRTEKDNGSAMAAANACLRSSAYPPLRGVRCTVDGGAVVLSGSVPSFYLKQLAQEMVRKLDGVSDSDIVNRLHVHVEGGKRGYHRR